MGVRELVPDSIAFTVEIQLSTVKVYRVRVTLDLRERLIILTAGILRDVVDRLAEFVGQLSEIAANQLALLKWDGTSDMTTEYTPLRVLSGYVADRSIVRFNVVLGESAPIHLEEVPRQTTIHL